MRNKDAEAKIQIAGIQTGDSDTPRSITSLSLARLARSLYIKPLKLGHTNRPQATGHNFRIQEVDFG